MFYSNIEQIIGKSSFIGLFCLMLFYWVQASYSFERNYKKFGFFGMLLVNFLLAALLIIRWFSSGHFPLSNLYESLLFLSWTFTTIHLIIESSTNQFLIGVITAPLALFTNAFANFSLPIEMQKSTALVPALQSNWLMMHVSIMMISYAALIAGSVFSMVYLILDSVTSSYHFGVSRPESSINKAFQTGTLSQQEQNSVFSVKIDSKTSLSTLAENLDNLSYRTLGLGFPFLTIGILSGAVWANEAWGSYWSWDPKETWAFITWLVFAIYLHTRIVKGWGGRKPAIIATFGFIVVWICYLGVNLIGSGLHSYGWFNN